MGPQRVQKGPPEGVHQGARGVPTGEEAGQEEEALSQREALTTELRAKLNALDQTLELQRV
jgi:hypothetical protein